MVNFEARDSNANPEWQLHGPMPRLTTPQRNWYSGIYDQTEIDSIEQQTFGERNAFLHNLGNAYRSLPIHKTDMELKTERVKQLGAFLNGATYRDLGIAEGKLAQAIHSRLKIVSANIRKQMGEDELGMLLDISVAVAEPTDEPKSQPKKQVAITKTPVHDDDLVYGTADKEPVVKASIDYSIEPSTTPGAARNRLLSHEPLENFEQEMHLAKRVERGDMAAKDEFIEEILDWSTQ